MSQLVCSQVAALVEALTTLLTFIRLLTCVNSHMCLEGTQFIEALTTLLAFMFSFVLMYGLDVLL